MITEEEFRALKPGDRVLVKVEIDDRQDGGRLIGHLLGQTKSSGQPLPIDTIHSILHRPPEPIKVGDVVTWGRAEAAYELVGWHGHQRNPALRSIDATNAIRLGAPSDALRHPTPSDPCWPAVEAWRKKKEG